MNAAELFSHPQRLWTGAERQDVIVCLSPDALDPYSVRLECVPLGGLSVTSRRRFLGQLTGAFAGALILPALLESESFAAEEEKAFISDGIDPADLWLDGKQIVVAFKQGEEMGEMCRALDDMRAELPVAIEWKLPEEWVKVFPTIHFETSSRKWKVYEGWEDLEHFTKHYEQFNPPPHSNDDASPFKEYAADYPGAAWSFPGKIADHLRDPKSLHKFSAYEIRDLSKEAMINLHSAHHENLIEPGRNPASKPPPNEGSRSTSGSFRRRRSIFRRRRR